MLSWRFEPRPQPAAWINWFVLEFNPLAETVALNPSTKQAHQTFQSKIILYIKKIIHAYGHPCFQNSASYVAKMQIIYYESIVMNLSYCNVRFLFKLYEPLQSIFLFVIQVI